MHGCDIEIHIFVQSYKVITWEGELGKKWMIWTKYMYREHLVESHFVMNIVS